MSEDEVVMLIGSLVVGGISWLVWYVRLFGVRIWRPRGAVRLPLGLAPVAAAILTLLILMSMASHDVTNDPKYIFFYMALGAAWLGVIRWFFPAFGISYRDDALERQNRAAAYALFGALQGITLCYAGGNIGDGPGWWVVVYAASLSTGSLLLLWAGLQAFTDIAEIITVERDLAAGLRFAGWSMATGLILGAAVAGDWQSAMQTNIDFVQRAWPVIPLWLVAILLDRQAKPTLAAPQPHATLMGMVPATAYVLVSILWLLLVGPEQ